MAKSIPSEAAEVPGAVPDTTFPLTVEEFCTRLSATDKRVEMIGGFFHDETSAGRIKDTEAAFAARFAEFVKRPCQ